MIRVYTPILKLNLNHFIFLLIFKTMNWSWKQLGLMGRLPL